MEQNEKPIILVVVTSLLALVLVYVVYHRIHSKPTNTTPNLVTQELSDTIQHTATGFIMTATDTSTDELAPITESETTLLSPREQKIRDLVDYGIRPYYGTFSIAKHLGIEVDFAFTDTGGILYGSLSSGADAGLASAVQRFGGNLLEINTKNRIIEHHLRGDSVTFVNIPGTTFVQQQGVEQRLLVAMIVSMEGDKRLVQLPFKLYYANKDTMKAHFHRLYDIEE